MNLFLLLAALALPAARDDDKSTTEKEECHGTAITFVSDPKLAAKLAEKERKLVMVLHVSGNFEDPEFT